MSIRFLPWATLMCVAFWCSPLVTVAQDCAPQSPVTVPHSQLSQNRLENLFRTHQPSYTQGEVERLKQSVAACNARIGEQIRLVNGQIRSLSLRYQEVLSIRDVGGILQTIQELEKSKEESKQELEKNLNKTEHSGLFVALIRNISIYEDVNTFIQQAQQSLAPRAIEDLNGTAIRRISRVSDLSEVQDVITSMTKGKTRVKEVLFDQPNYEERHFLYVAKVGVSPLKEGLSGQSNLDNTNSIVLNVLIDQEYRNTLKAEGVSDSDVKTIEEKIKPMLDLIKLENQDADRQQKNILERGNERILDIEREIEDARRKLANRSRKIEEACEEFGLPFDRRNLDQSAERILQYLRGEVGKLNNDWRAYKSKEIIEENTIVPITGSPIASFSEEAINLSNQLKNKYGTVQKLQELTRVENFELTDFQSNQTVEVYRELEQVWLYPVGRPDGTFSLTLFGRFRITDRIKEGEGKNSWTSSPEELPNMVYIQGGTFKMGDQFGDGDDDEDLHTVTVSDYYLGRHEVTFAEYAEYCAAKDISLPDDEGWGKGERPVINVSWYDAIEYCNWRSEQEGLTPVYRISGRDVMANWNANGYRLPTEAEWEYAARSGGQKVRFGNGKDIADASEMNFDASESYKKSYSRVGRYLGKTVEVGSYDPNNRGLYDMAGNVWEWCWDWYDSDYYSVSDGATDPRGPVTGSYRVLRGGSWLNTPGYCRAAYRSFVNPSFSDNYLGFRLALSSSR